MRDRGPRPDSLWRHRDFLLLWSGESASQVGTRIGEIAIPLLAVTVLGATPWQMGLLTAAQTAGFLLIGLLAGVVLDRVRRFPVMIASDLARFALLVTVPVAGWFGVLGYLQLLAVAFLAGLCTVFFDVAYQSVLPSLVGRPQLVDGNGKLESTRAVAAAGGPAVGGGLVQLVGAAGAVLVDAVSFLASAAVLSRIRTVEPAPTPSGTSVLTEIGEGLRFVLGNPLLRPIVLCTGTANLFTGVMQAALALFLARELALPAGVVGLVLACTGVGAVLGAVTAGAWTRRLGQARTIVWSLLVTSPIMLLIPLAQPGALLGAAALGLIALGYGSVVYNVAQVSFRQAVCPDRLLGRMNASARFLVWGTIPLGGLLGGALGDTIGPRATLLVVAVGNIAAPLWILASPLRRLRDLPTGPCEGLRMHDARHRSNMWTFGRTWAPPSTRGTMTPFTMTAVHSQGPIGRTGSLRITDRGLRFTPMQTNLPGQREPLELAFADVTFVGTAPRRFWPPAFNGQYLRRLQLGSRETGTHLFVVRNVDETARVVRDLWLHEKTD